MPPFEGQQFALFLAFFVPGLISIKIYDLLWPSERRDWSKAAIEAIGFSAINFAVLSPVIFPTLIGYGIFANPWLQICVAFVTLLVAPTVWPIILRRVLHHSGLLLDPVRKPWDLVFRGRGEWWIIIHLTDGRRIGGRFGRRSMASSYPAEEQLDLEEVWDWMPMEPSCARSTARRASRSRRETSKPLSSLSRGVACQPKRSDPIKA